MPRRQQPSTMAETEKLSGGSFLDPFPGFGGFPGNSDLRHKPKLSQKQCLEQSLTYLRKYECNPQNAGLLTSAEMACKTGLSTTGKRSRSRKLLTTYAKICKYSSNFKAAVSTYGTIITEFPGQSVFDDIIVECAVLLDKLGMKEESLKYFQYALNETPGTYNEGAILLLLATHYAKEGEMKMSREAMKLAFETKNRKGEMSKWLDDVQTWEELGDICARNDNSFAAMEAYSQAALTYNGKSSKSLWPKLADCLMLYQERKNAIEALTIGHKLDPFNINVRTRLFLWENNTWKPIFDEEERLISLIQARYRGCVMRRFVKAEKRKRLKIKIIAATHIQRIIRGYFGRKTSHQRRNVISSIILQCFVRQYLARKQLFILKEVRKMQHEAAIIIQKQFRTHLSRIIVRAIRAELIRKQKENAIIIIQPYCRGYLGRKKARRQKEKIQSAIIIQRVARVMLGRRFATRAKHRYICALTIQRVVRGYFGRLIFHRRFTTPATIMQSVYRAFIVRKGVYAYCEATRLQRLRNRHSRIGWNSLKWRIICHSDDITTKSAIKYKGRQAQPLLLCSFGNQSTLTGQTAHDYIFGKGNNEANNTLCGVRSILFHTDNEKSMNTFANLISQCAGKLYEFGVGGQGVTKRSMMDINQTLKNSETLRAIHVENKEGAETIIRTLFTDNIFCHYSQLEIINLRRSGLKSEHCKYLSTVLLISSLKTLRLDCNQISCNGVKYISSALARNSCLEELDLSANRVGDAGIIALAEALPLCNLRKLFLQENSITTLGALHLEGYIFPEIPEKRIKVAIEAITLQRNQIIPCVSSRIMQKVNDNFLSKWCA